MKLAVAVPLRRRIPLHLWLLAGVALTAWLVIEPIIARPLATHYLVALDAARSMQNAMQVIRHEKQELGLLQSLQDDPNRTGLIGPEASSLVTTLGVLASKRTATNPDLAAALINLLTREGIMAGDKVVIVLSGSLIGANIATILAVEALGADPVIIDSVGGSMWGGVDPEFTWLDMHDHLLRAGIVKTPSLFAVVGGYDGLGVGLEPEGLVAIEESALRAGTDLLKSDSLAGLVEAADARLHQAVTPGETAVLINVGGAMVSLGNCLELSGLAGGINRRGIDCIAGEPGLVSRWSHAGVPVLHLINMKFLALDLGLPYDPMPLPTPGNNRRVYGS